MKRLVAAVLACAWIAAAHAEGKVRAIPFVAKPGDTAKVTITHARTEKSDYGDKTTNVKLVYQAEIVGETKEGYKLTWHPKSLTVKGQTVDTTTERAEIDQDIALEFETDNTGAPETLLNHKAVIENGMRAAEQNLARHGEEALKAARAAFEKLTPKAAAGMFGKHANMIGFFQGFSLEVGKPKAYKDKLPNPLGTGFIETDASITLTSVDDEKNLATYEWQQTADPASFKKVLAEMLTTMSSGKPVDQKALDAMSLDIRYRATATVRLSDGWVDALTYETYTVINDGKQEKKRNERYDITVER